VPEPRKHRSQDRGQTLPRGANAIDGGMELFSFSGRVAYYRLGASHVAVFILGRGNLRLLGAKERSDNSDDRSYIGWRCSPVYP
jgi:hypothetical protein